MRVLIIGGGGREHALAWRFVQDDPAVQLFATPGNPGIATLGRCIPANIADVQQLEALARECKADLTVVGPEAPLAAGIVDHFNAAGLPIFGPTRAAAEIETSKAFAKQMMLEDGIPTARAEMHTSPALAKQAAARFGAPVVIKASGLASGKGVIVCDTLADAELAIDDMLSGNRFGVAGHEVLVEEFMEGEELSVFAITDGLQFVLLPGLQDHKRLLNGDKGPNTGGMGAYLPVSLSVSLADIESIFTATLAGLQNRGRRFTGLLYCGLMITPDGPRVVEFNCRFGDPETQALLPVLRMKPTLLEVMQRVASGEPLGETTIELTGACVTTVLAAANYPEAPRTGDPITFGALHANESVFHAGTALRDDRLVTNGGRVVAVSASAVTIAEAQSKSAAAASRISFDGKQNRTDIGWREIARAARD